MPQKQQLAVSKTEEFPVCLMEKELFYLFKKINHRCIKCLISIKFICKLFFKCNGKIEENPDMIFVSFFLLFTNYSNVFLFLNSSNASCSFKYLIIEKKKDRVEYEFSLNN